MEQELPGLLQSYELRGKQPFVSDFSRLLQHAIEKGRGPILYSKKNPRPHGETYGSLRIQFLLLPLGIIRQWLCGKAASDLDRILCVVLVKTTPGKHVLVQWPPRHNCNTVENGVKQSIY